MRFSKIIIILVLCQISCKGEKQAKIEDKSKPPKVELNILDSIITTKTKSSIYVNDLEKLLSKDQSQKLEKQLINLDKETGKKILILTIPTKEKLDKKWTVENDSFTNFGIIITVSNS